MVADGALVECHLSCEHLRATDLPWEGGKSAGMARAHTTVSLWYICDFSTVCASGACHQNVVVCAPGVQALFPWSLHHRHAVRVPVQVLLHAVLTRHGAGAWAEGAGRGDALPGLTDVLDQVSNRAIGSGCTTAMLCSTFGV